MQDETFLLYEKKKLLWLLYLKGKENRDDSWVYQEVFRAGAVVTVNEKTDPTCCEVCFLKIDILHYFYNTYAMMTLIYRDP